MAKSATDDLAAKAEAEAKKEQVTPESAAAPAAGTKYTDEQQVIDEFQQAYKRDPTAEELSTYMKHGLVGGVILNSSARTVQLQDGRSATVYDNDAALSQYMGDSDALRISNASPGSVVGVKEGVKLADDLWKAAQTMDGVTYYVRQSGGGGGGGVLDIVDDALGTDLAKTFDKVVPNEAKLAYDPLGITGDLIYKGYGKDATDAFTSLTGMKESELQTGQMIGRSVVKAALVAAGLAPAAAAVAMAENMNQVAAGNIGFKQGLKYGAIGAGTMLLSPGLGHIGQAALAAGAIKLAGGSWEDAGEAAAWSVAGGLTGGWSNAVRLAVDEDYSWEQLAASVAGQAAKNVLDGNSPFSSFKSPPLMNSGEWGKFNPLDAKAWGTPTEGVKFLKSATQGMNAVRQYIQRPVNSGSGLREGPRGPSSPFGVAAFV